MRAFRIVKKRHALTAFSGDGAREYGGRWNEPGIPMVYAAQTRALAALESLAHYAGAERRIAFVVFELEVAEALVMRLPLARLPADWRGEEPSASTQAPALPTLTEATSPEVDPSAEVTVRPISCSAWLSEVAVNREARFVLLCTACPTSETVASWDTICEGSIGCVGSWFFISAMRRVRKSL